MLLTKMIQHDIRQAGVFGKGQSARCFRHNFRDALRNQRTPDDVVRTVGGWSQRSIHNSYGIGPSLQVLNQYVSAVTYPGLDISHLYSSA
jgi:hypothetical protein